MGNLESGCNSEGARVGAISWSSGNRFGHTMRQLEVKCFVWLIVGNRRVLRREFLRGIFGVCVGVLAGERKVIERRTSRTPNYEFVWRCGVKVICRTLKLVVLGSSGVYNVRWMLKVCISFIDRWGIKNSCVALVGVCCVTASQFFYSTFSLPFRILWFFGPNKAVERSARRIWSSWYFQFCEILKQVVSGSSLVH